MAATSTIKHNKVHPKCQKYGIQYIKIHIFRVRKCTFSDIKNTIVWMVYKIAIGSCKQLYQNLEKRLLNEHQSTCWLFYWIKPWIDTFWTHCSGTQCLLAPPGYLSTYAICYTIDLKALNTWKVTASQCSGQLYWFKPWICTFWAYYSGI